MANNIAFQPMGKTTRLNVTTTSAEVAVNADSPCNQVRLHNGTASEMFVRFSPTTGNAAIIPASGTPAYGIVLHNNQTQVFTVPQSFTSATNTLYVSAIVATGTGILYITPGEGL
jgi:hypothetical protein